MCGICGIFGPQVLKAQSREIVERMMTVLSHRGPDDSGMSQGDDYIFGHRRLSIIDIEHGKQPMQTEDGSLTLIFNGEIYNYLELRQEMIRTGIRFLTFSDTEVLLRLYQVYGKACLSKINGMFAFAIYDHREKELFAARDHFGIKPFYYYQFPDGSIGFASEIKALFQHPDIQPVINQTALNEYLTFQFCLGEKTLFEGIRKLEPGCFLVKPVADSSIKTVKYWHLSFDVDTHHTEEYFIDKLQMLLQRSVEGQLRSDVPVGGYLSGGVDSSTVVTLAANIYGNGFKSFTGKFSEGPEYDESSYARKVAQEIHSEYFEIIPTAGDFIDCLPKLIYHMDEPAAGPGLFPQYLVSQLARQHVTVVLGGQGGDEIFGGYARYLVAYLEQCLKGGIYETQEEGQHIVTLSSIIPNLSILKQYVPLIQSFWKDGVFDSMDKRYFRLIDRSHNLKNILHSDVWAAYNRDDVFSQFQAIFNRPDTKSYFNKMTHFDQQTLLPALLQVEDRVSMAVSLESRVPLLDPRIAEFVAHIPPNLKFQGGSTKYLLKKAVGTLLPEKIVNRKDKMGFPVPLNEWWSGPLREFVADILFSKTCRERGIFNNQELELLITDEGKFGRQLWGALCLELWQREFFDAN